MLYLSMQMESGANLLKIEHRAHQNGRRLLGGVVKNVVQMGLGLEMSGCTPGRWAVGFFWGLMDTAGLACRFLLSVGSARSPGLL